MNEHRAKIVNLLRSKQDENIMLAFQLSEQAGFDIEAAWRWFVYGFFKQVAETECRAEGCYYENYISSDTIKMTFCNNVLAFKYKQEEDEFKELTKDGCTIVGAVLFDGQYYCFEFEFDINKHEVPPIYKAFSGEQQTIWLTINECLKRIKAFALRAYFGYNEPIDFGLFKPQNA